MAEPGQSVPEDRAVQGLTGKRVLCTSQASELQSGQDPQLPKPPSSGCPAVTCHGFPSIPVSPLSGALLLTVLCVLPRDLICEALNGFHNQLQWLLPTSMNRCVIKKKETKDLHSQYCNWNLSDSRLMTCLKSQRWKQCIQCTGVTAVTRWAASTVPIIYF